MIAWGMLLATLAGVWVFFDARKRGSELPVAAMWALGTAMIMVVFLPLYLLFGRKAPVKYRRDDVIDVEAIPVEEIIYCRMCGGKAKEALVTCPHCGHTLKPKCNSCGKELDRSWKVCPFCEAPAENK